MEKSSKKSGFSFVSLWKARDELSIKNVRPAFWSAWLLFPLAIILSDLRFVDLETELFGYDSVLLIMISYSLGWLICVFLPPKFLSQTIKICTIILAVTLAGQFVLGFDQSSMFMFLIFHLAIGVCVACGFYVYVFTLQNAERFFGMAFIIIYYSITDMIWQYDSLSFFLQGPGAVIVLLAFAAAAFLGSKENYPIRGTPKENKQRGYYIVFFIYTIFFIIDLTNMYIDYDAEFSIGFWTGIGGFIAMALAFIVQMGFNKSVWHMLNIFLILSIIGAGLFIIGGSVPDITGSILYGTANSVGYFAVIYMMGGAGKRSGSLSFFRLACFFIFITNSVVAIGFDNLYWYVIYDYNIHYDVVVFVIVLALACICIMLTPILDKKLFNTHWSDEFEQPSVDELGLTAREREIFLLLLTEDSPKQIAGKLMISTATVNFHTNNLYRKLNIQSRTQLFAEYSGSVDKNI